jgi:chorismate mutase-like protein
MAGRDQEAALGQLRGEIDRIDATMHGLLMERGRIIDRLIEVKGGTAATGSAFRPEREASMIRRMAQRHEGRLPFDAVEGIWRIIITTFTHLQAPFSVHVDGSGDAGAARDSARFHFGFVVPLDTSRDAAAVIEAVARSRGDLGLVPASTSPDRAWWKALEAEDAPKIIARLPFVERSGHPVPYPMFVLAKSVSGEGLGAHVLLSIAATGAAAITQRGGQTIAQYGDDTLMSLPRELLPDAGGATVVGSHPSTDPA